MSTYVKKVLELIAQSCLVYEDKVCMLVDLMKYPKLTIEDLDYIYGNTPFIHRFMDKITVHPLVTFEWLLERQDDNNVHSDVLWDKITSNPNVTTETVEKYPNQGWDWYYMHFLKDLNIEFILTHIKKRWNWCEVMRVIPFEDFLKIDFRNVGFYDITLEFIGRGLSENLNITIQNVIEHPQINWFPKQLLQNPSIKKDLNLDLILSQIKKTSNGTELFAFILKFFVNEQPVSDELVEKMRLVPPSLGADDWFFKSNKYQKFKLETMPYVDPKDLTLEMLHEMSMTSINEKVANFYIKCDTEIAKCGNTFGPR